MSGKKSLISDRVSLMSSMNDLSLQPRRAHFDSFGIQRVIKGTSLLVLTLTNASAVFETVRGRWKDANFKPTCGREDSRIPPASASLSLSDQRKSLHLQNDLISVTSWKRTRGWKRGTDVFCNLSHATTMHFSFARSPLIKDAFVHSRPGGRVHKDGRVHEDGLDLKANARRHQFSIQKNKIVPLRYQAKSELR